MRNKMSRACITCGNRFNPHGPQKTCGKDECKKEHRCLRKVRNATVIGEICERPGCGNQIAPFHPSTKRRFCSNRCKAMKVPVHRQCQRTGCKNEINIVGSKKNRIFCSLACCWMVQSKAIRGKICKRPGCGREIPPFSPSAIKRYCSQECYWTRHGGNLLLVTSCARQGCCHMLPHYSSRPSVVSIYCSRECQNKSAADVARQRQRRRFDSAMFALNQLEKELLNGRSNNTSRSSGKQRAAN